MRLIAEAVFEEMQTRQIITRQALRQKPMRGGPGFECDCWVRPFGGTGYHVIRKCCVAEPHILRIMTQHCPQQRDVA